MIEAVLTGAIRSGTSVLFPCLGEVVAQRAGIINLGTEGSMLMGALAAFAVTAATGNPFLGVAAGGLGGAMLAFVHAFLVIERRANQLATGLALMILGQGLTAFFGRSFVNRHIDGFNPLNIPVLSDIPILGSILFKHDFLTYLAILLVPGVWFFLYRTRWGLTLRAAGERESVVYACGRRVKPVKYLAVTCGGFLAGIGGAHLSTAYTLNWTENMTYGRGIVAVALVIFASWLPFRAMLGAYLFGGASVLQPTFQVQGIGISPFLLSMIPYVLTLLVLLTVRQHRYTMPEGLRAVFEGSGNTASFTDESPAPGKGVDT